MSNMSYCRFQNTLSDLRDCQDALREQDLEDVLKDLSIDEQRAAKALIETCADITDEFISDEED